MFCPSCERLMPDEAKYCGRCGMFLTSRSARLVHLTLDLSWIWRRSWAGFASGFFGWIIVFLISRMIRPDMGMLLNNLFSGMICGVFLGTVGGIIEESGYKAVFGGVLGTLGGALGALLNMPLAQWAQAYDGIAALPVLATWSVGGAFIGAASGALERDGRKVFAGILAGLVGGAVGGYLGSVFYGSALMEFEPQGWLGHRLAEGLSGGLVGAVLWFCIGFAEKLYIFRRREDPTMDRKICDACGAENSLGFWYCGQCGRVLQQAAPRQKIAVTPYRGIERIGNALRFLSWLFGVTGIVTTPVIFAIFLMQNLFLACVSAVFSVLLTYLMVIGFRFIADLLGCLARLSHAAGDRKDGTPCT